MKWSISNPECCRLRRLNKLSRRSCPVQATDRPLTQAPPPSGDPLTSCSTKAPALGPGLHWAQGCIGSFPSVSWDSQDIFPEVGSLGQTAAPCLMFRATSTLFSAVAAPSAFPPQGTGVPFSRLPRRPLLLVDLLTVAINLLSNCK